ncbi:MAG: DNA-3-methyladenine glycosylase [Ktedonobacterales bacterium]|nr:DNA-3-methyladenine glycosylase [Ktedonobacterales bacterium]
MMSDQSPEQFMPAPLPHAYYTQPTLDIARDLLGKTLWRADATGIVAGVIVETEGYISAIDPASHNYRKPSKRSMTMFGPPGHAYVYLTYGMHHCLNVVTEPAGESAAVLIRAAAPLTGRDQMALRCPRCLPRDLARGPGRLCAAFGLTIAQNGLDLTGDTLWISEPPNAEPLDPARIATSPRIGITQGIDLPWRFFIRDHPAVSGPAWLNRGQPRPSTVAPSRANSDQNAG